MVVRPRLVEEGIPLWDESTTMNRNRDGNFSTGTGTSSSLGNVEPFHVPSYHQRQNPNRNIVGTAPLDRPTELMSSLQRATIQTQNNPHNWTPQRHSTSKQYNTKNLYKRKTHFVIGEESCDTSGYIHDCNPQRQQQQEQQQQQQQQQQHNVDDLLYSMSKKINHTFEEMNCKMDEDFDDHVNSNRTQSVVQHNFHVEQEPLGLLHMTHHDGTRFTNNTSLTQWEHQQPNQYLLGAGPDTTLTENIFQPDASLRSLTFSNSDSRNYFSNPQRQRTKRHIEIGAMDTAIDDENDVDHFNHNYSNNYVGTHNLDGDPFSEGYHRKVDKMVGVEDQGSKMPMVVLDGANIAYAYSQLSSSIQTSLSNNDCRKSKSTFIKPDVRGIRVACHFFTRVGFRVLVVLKQSYYSRVQTTSLNNSSSYRSQQDNDEDDVWVEVIEKYLKREGMLVLAPSSDDDDAYCLTVALRENVRANYRMQNYNYHYHHSGNISQDFGGSGYAYVVSNDMFRDAQQRQQHLYNSNELGHYLNVDVRGQIHGSAINTTNGNTVGSSHGSRNSSIATACSADGGSEFGPGRISFTFVDMGSIDEHGDHELDFVPNPRHPLIQWIERQQLHPSKMI